MEEKTVLRDRKRTESAISEKEGICTWCSFLNVWHHRFWLFSDAYAAFSHLTLLTM